MRTSGFPASNTPTIPLIKQSLSIFVIMSKWVHVVEFVGHEGPVTSIEFNKDMKYLLSSSQDSTIRVWSLNTKKQVTIFRGHIGSVNDFALNSDNSRVFSGGEDFSVAWWDVERGTLIRKIRSHNGAVNSVCFNEHSSLAFSGSLDSTVKIWDCRAPGNAPACSLDDSKDSVTAVATTRTEILTGSVDGKLRIYDIRNSCINIDSFSHGIVSLDVSKQQHAILVSTLSSHAYLHVKSTGENMQKYSSHVCTKYLVRARLAANDSKVITGSETGSVFIYDLVRGTLQHSFEFGTGPILAVAAVPSFETLAVASSNGMIGIFKSCV